MKPFELKRCARCGYEWGSTSEEPRRCPSCGTYHWNEPPKTYSCLRCGHKWTAKRDWPPKRCPKCRSVAWNTEKKEVPKPEPGVAKSAIASMDEETVKTVLDAYKKGYTCTKIAVETSIPFSVVYGIIRDSYATGSVRV